MEGERERENSHSLPWPTRLCLNGRESSERGRGCHSAKMWGFAREDGCFTCGDIYGEWGSVPRAWARIVGSARRPPQEMRAPARAKIMCVQDQTGQFCILKGCSSYRLVQNEQLAPGSKEMLGGILLCTVHLK